MSAPMHISVGAMDGHTQLLFYSLCFGPFLVLVAISVREYRRNSREDPLHPSAPPHDTDHYFAPELRRRPTDGPGPRGQTTGDDQDDEAGSPG
jgi:hypothetical protein